MHWLALRRINALDSPLPVRLGNPNLLRSGRAVDENNSSFGAQRCLEVQIQQAMDVLEVLRKNPLRPNDGDLKEDRKWQQSL